MSRMQYVLPKAFQTCIFHTDNDTINEMLALFFKILIFYHANSKGMARFLSLAQSKLRLCLANHRPGYWSNLPCDWLTDHSVSLLQTRDRKHALNSYLLLSYVIPNINR